MEAVAAASPGAAVAGHDSVPLRKRAASMYSLDQQLKVVRLIGEGTFGKVYEGEDTLASFLCALSTTAYIAAAVPRACNCV
jgi:hypothetical protein